MPERGRRVAAAAVAGGLAALLIGAAQSRSPTIEDLGGNRHRLSLSLRTDSQPREYAEAQDRLRQEAERLCQGTGRAVAEGPVAVGSAPRGRTSLSQVFACVASDPTRPPPAG